MAPILLIVEDSANIRDVLTILFQLMWPDARVACAADGTTALRLALEEWPDLIILDVDLPDVDGFQVCTEIRRRSTMPIVMLSACDPEGGSARGLAAGANAYVSKPFDLVEFRALVRTFLSPSLR
jgi:DNA-binding response OmpR family regulator